MNKFSGQIAKVSVEGQLSVVDVNCSGVMFKAIMLETPESFTELVPSRAVNVLIKETEIVLTPEPNPVISMRNRVRGPIKRIDEGQLLCSVVIDTEIGEVESVITRNAVKELALTQGSKVTALIKTNEVMLSFD